MFIFEQKSIYMVFPCNVHWTIIQWKRKENLNRFSIVDTASFWIYSVMKRNATTSATKLLLQYQILVRSSFTVKGVEKGTCEYFSLTFYSVNLKRGKRFLQLIIIITCDCQWVKAYTPLLNWPNKGYTRTYYSRWPLLFPKNCFIWNSWPTQIDQKLVCKIYLWIEKLLMVEV